MPEALKKADEVLQQAVQGITDLINIPSVINLDFADVQTVMKDKGIAHIGIGQGKGDDKAMDAVKQAVESPLLAITVIVQLSDLESSYIAPRITLISSISKDTGFLAEKIIFSK